MVPVVAPAEICLVRLRVELPRRSPERHRALVRQHHPNAVAHRLRHLVLQLQGVAQVAVVRIAPQMLVAPGINQLCCNPHPVSRAHHRPFDHRVHPQLSRNLRQCLQSALILHHRSA